MNFERRICDLTHRLPLAFSAGLAISISLIASAIGSDEIEFNRQIRPILSRHCFSCHGPDDGQREADFRLDLRDEALVAIEPGDVDGSELFDRITSPDDDERMPPPEHGAALNHDEIELIRNWIEEGAKYQQHWSFVAPRKAELPPLDQHRAAWTRNEIDYFVADKLVEMKLEPAPAADPRRLIRRLALDLTGLPPARGMVERFVQTPTDETYETIVDELLASPDYGEHWTAMWLDLARYADTIGYAEDRHRDIWPWRDWVIRAFNDNMPYDQFTIEQLAGDLLPAATSDQILATAFHRNTLNNTEGGTSDEEFRVVAVKDRISTTVNVWMGLTLRCAECHTHKYDPISQKEYYQFFDFFNQTEDADLGDERPKISIFPAGREAEFERLDEEIAVLKETAATKEETQRLTAAMDDRNSPILVPIMKELDPEHARTTHVMIRGSYLQPGEQVSAAVMQAFHPLPPNVPHNRLGVAQWLVSENNPLTARVTVNRFWARLFGTGIVETEEDFGTQGSLPTHPQLLDWLAVDFREHGWDVKRMLKQMVMSSTYRQSSIPGQASLELDPRNLFLSHGPRFRLSAEVIRDQALAVSGLLSRKQYGPPVYPPNPVKKVRSAFQGETVWTESQGEDRYRRTLYTYLKRSSPHPLFETFDMATREVCCIRRIRTNTPLQSFMTLNDQIFVEAAQALARKMYESDDDCLQQIANGFSIALLRPATESELETLGALYQSTLAEYAQQQDLARQMAGIDQTGQANENNDQAIAELAALSVIANVILNLDEFLTK
jgi:hypothetical protein